MISSISPINLRLFVLQILVGLLAIISFLKLGHYLINPTYFIFDTPSAIFLSQNSQEMSIQAIDLVKIIQNLLLISLFYVQHIVMAKIKFKVIASNKWPNFPMYERIIYNLMSSILLIFVIEYQQPQPILLYTIPSIISYPLAMLGTGLFVMANVQMQQSIMFPYKFQQLLSSRQVLLKQNNYEKIEQNGITIKGAYSLVRHPMQGGALLLLTFGSPIFTVEKLSILTSIIIFIVIGVKMQQQRLLKKFTQYKSYMQIVKNRFIPYVI